MTDQDRVIIEQSGVVPDKKVRFFRPASAEEGFFGTTTHVPTRVRQEPAQAACRKPFSAIEIPQGYVELTRIPSHYSYVSSLR
jgi:hypothetical protein